MSQSPHSPLSDILSSSSGADTEPLGQTSNPSPPKSSSKRPSASGPSGGAAGGNDSDSSLTEQSSSNEASDESAAEEEEEEDEDEEDVDGDVVMSTKLGKGGRKRAVVESEDEESASGSEEDTPRARNSGAGGRPGGAVSPSLSLSDLEERAEGSGAASKKDDREKEKEVVEEPMRDQLSSADEDENDPALPSHSTSTSSSSAPALSTLQKSLKRPRSPSIPLPAGLENEAEIAEAVGALADLSAPHTGVVELETEPQGLKEQLERMRDEEEEDGVVQEGEVEGGIVVEDKGKAPAVDGEEEYGDEGASEHEHEEEGSADDAFMRKRAEAMEELTKIEIGFAKLRDKLYIERMMDVEKERMGIETGTHPELIQFNQLVEMRRTKKLELAKKWLEGLEDSYERQRASEEHTVWTWWSDERAELRSTMLDEAYSKKRKLEREKRAMDRPKEPGLTPYLAPRPVPTVPLQHRRRLGFDGELLMENDIAWALRHPDVRIDATVSGLDEEAAWQDMERMGLRAPVPQPGMYAFEPGFPTAQPVNFADPRAGPPNPLTPFGGSYSTAFDSAGLGSGLPPPQHHFGALGSLPPLPSQAGQSRVDFPARPPSNPRTTAPHSRTHSNTGIRGYPSHFASTFGGGDSHDSHQPPGQAQQQAAPSWKAQLPQSMYQFDEGRRAPGPAGLPALGESLDIVAEHHPRRTTHDANDKMRPSLDHHMANARSPKAAKTVNSNSAASSAFMAIPPFQGGASRPVV
ncbi:Sds3-like protein [Pseudohyphozyma bogoriensis]|nr:Sds3-like protein [Pseudohyphozyma bogoriensis]